MKKLLTIVALALILCLGISAALAARNEKQTGAIAVRLTESGVLESSDKLETSKLHIDETSLSGSFGWTYDGTAVTGTVLNCVQAGKEHNFTGSPTYYTYTYWDATKFEAVSYSVTDKKTSMPAPLSALSHFGDVARVTICQDCGYLRVEPLAGKIGHTFPDALTKYTLTNAAKASIVEKTFVTSDTVTITDAINAWKCKTAKDTKLYSYKACSDPACPYVEFTEVAKANGDHSYGTSATVVEPSTCKENGWEAIVCSVCKTEKPGTREYLPLAGHSYTVKVYNFDETNGGNKDKKPNCETGLNFIFTLQCPNCGQFEGDLMKPDFVNHGHPDTELTFEDKVKLLGWSKDITEGVKRYDADGHHYSVLVPGEYGPTEYTCAGGTYWTYACEHCGKKLVITSGENKPTYAKKLVDKVETIDCLTVKVTYKCDVCGGKVANHKTTVEETLLPSDPKAHNEGKYFVEDLTKYVAPTCLDAGSKTLVCKECGYTKTVGLDKLDDHLWTKYEKVSSNVWKRTCQRCGIVATVEGKKDEPKDITWVKTGNTGAATCLEPSWVEYKKVNKDGTDAKVGDKLVLQYIYGEYGDHIMSKVGNYAGEKKATCSEEGIELWICARCTNYNPDKTDAKTIDDMMSCKVAGRAPCYEVKATEKVAHTWGKPVVVPATAEKDGTSTKTCTVCGETEVTVIPYEKADAFYKLTNVKYDGTSVTGKLTHVDGTKEAEMIKVRVTFYIEGNYYMATMAEVAADGSFSVDGVGPIKYITVAVTGNSSVNPEDYQKIAEPEEIFVK